MRGGRIRRRAIAAIVALAAGGAALAGPAPAAPGPRADSNSVSALEAPVGQLELDRAMLGAGALVIRAEQRVGGYPVLGAESVVLRDGAGAATVIADDSVAGLDAPPAPTITDDAAVATARAAIGDPTLRTAPRASLVIEPESGELVWQVLLASEEPFADRELLISATGGQVVGRLLLTRKLTGRAKLHRDNPVVEQRSYRRLSDHGDANYRRLNRLRRNVELQRLRGKRGCLRGFGAIARAGAGERAVCRRSRDWRSVRRSAQSFEALMAYFQVDRARGYIDSLGLSRPVFDAPQRVNANALDADNSYFSPMTDEISLGRGGVDDGEDGEIIVHEYGHAIQDAQVPGFGRTSQGAAMGEGFGDYLAATTSARFDGGPKRFDACVGEWDSTSYSAKPSCLRRTDSKFALGKAQRRCGGDPHCVGLPWSAALWKLRRGLGEDTGGRTIMDRVTLESHFLLTPRSGFREGARALIGADVALYGGVHVAQIEDEMEAREFCPASGC